MQYTARLPTSLLSLACATTSLLSKDDTCCYIIQIKYACNIHPDYKPTSLLACEVCFQKIMVLHQAAYTL